ncbi:MAG: glycosyltransferase, partial [Methylophilaceae bacterium]
MNIIISATSDLLTDQRVNRTASALKESGHKVLVIGRRLKGSRALPSRRYRSVRFNMLFQRGPLFYVFFNLRLAWYLLWKKTDVLYSNDLDTLPANFLVSKIKRLPLIYDSHEYFTG